MDLLLFIVQAMTLLFVYMKDLVWENYVQVSDKEKYDKIVSWNLEVTLKFGEKFHNFHEF